MQIPKEFRSKVADFKRDYREFLDHGRDSDSEALNQGARHLETEMGRAGVRDPRRIIDAAREEVEAQRIEERKQALRSQRQVSV